MMPCLYIGRASAKAAALLTAAAWQGITTAEIIAKTHADTLYIPDNGKSVKISPSDASRKDGQRDEETVQGMIAWAAQKPSLSPYRVIVLEGFERASAVVPHALLKLLEEPSTHLRFVFTAKNEHRIIATILSRVHITRFPAPQAGEIDDPELLKMIQKGTISEWFLYIENLKDDDDGRAGVLMTLENMMWLAKKHEPYWLNDLLKTYESIDQNGHIRLHMEACVLCLFRLRGSKI
jgi:hypothetical protein